MFEVAPPMAVAKVTRIKRGNDFICSHPRRDEQAQVERKQRKTRRVSPNIAKENVLTKTKQRQIHPLTQQDRINRPIGESMVVVELHTPIAEGKRDQ